MIMPVSHRGRLRHRAAHDLKGLAPGPLTPEAGAFPRQPPQIPWPLPNSSPGVLQTQHPATAPSHLQVPYSWPQRPERARGIPQGRVRLSWEGEGVRGLKGVEEGVPLLALQQWATRRLQGGRSMGRDFPGSK